ncbi:hypothetical protein ACP4OV_009975 [Aristida adscensionis]
MAAASRRRLLLALAAAALALVPAASAAGQMYRVGGADGWRVPPPEEKDTFYATWASGITFLVGDSLEFVYKNDSVLKADKAGYYHCNGTAAGLPGAGAGAAAPRDGSMVFLLDAPGDAYFTSADAEHCKMGERLMISVLPAAGEPPAPTPAPLPAPGPWSWVVSPSSTPAAGPEGHHHGAASAGYALVAPPGGAAVLLLPATLALIAGLII